MASTTVNAPMRVMSDTGPAAAAQYPQLVGFVSATTGLNYLPIYNFLAPTIATAPTKIVVYDEKIDANGNEKVLINIDEDRIVSEIVERSIRGWLSMRAAR